MSRFKIPEIWDNDKPVYIIGGGPSIAYAARVSSPTKDSIKTVAEFLKPIHNARVIGVNNAYMLGSWIDVLWFGDCNWYVFHEKNLEKTFRGLKTSCCPRFQNNPKRGVVFFGRDSEKTSGITTKKDKIAWNKNSGSSAINVAYHLGARKIILLGFDMQDGKKEDTHWHGGHKEGAHNRKRRPFSAPYGRFLQGFPQIAADAKNLGVQIVNAVHPDIGSALDYFPKVTIKEVLDHANKEMVSVENAVV